MTLKETIAKYNPNTDYLYSDETLSVGITWHDMMLQKYCPIEIYNLNKILICDCDGILTDGNLGYFNSGKAYKSYGCHDHELIKLLRSCGWEILFVTNDKSGYEITNNRVKDLGCNVVQVSPNDRKELVKNYSNKGYIVAFFGDSPSDLPAAMNADYRYTTANCFNPIKKYFHYISPSDGGHGGFAECCYELVRKLYEHYTDANTKF